MTAPGLAPPSPIPAIGGDDVARVEQWVARQRAELSRLALAVRSAQVRAERAERAERDAPAEVEAPEELLSVLDSMLATAVQTAELAVQAALCDAVAIVAAEHERATDELRSLGLDPLVVLGPSGWTTSTTPDFARPASVGELWQNIQDEARAEATAPGVERPRVDDPPSLFDDAELFEAFWGGAESSRPSLQVVPASLGRSPPGRSAEPAAGVERPDADDPEPMSAVPSRWPDPERAARELPGPTERRPGLAPMPRASDDPEVLFDDAELFDVFWGGAELVGVGAERRRPIRDRLRRRVTQGQR